MRNRQAKNKKDGQSKTQLADKHLAMGGNTSAKKILSIFFIVLLIIAAISGVLFIFGLVNRNSQQKAAIKLDPPNDKFTSSTYHFIKNNPKATVTLFGEHHLRQNETTLALTELTKSNTETFVLFEFAPRNKPVSCGSLYKKNGDVTCLGMEDPQYVLESHQSRIEVSTAETYQTIFNYHYKTKNSTLTDKFVTEYARKNLQLTREITQALQFVPDLAALLNTPAESFNETYPVNLYVAYLTCKQIMSERANNSSYETIFQKNKDQLTYSAPDLSDYFIKRNKVFADTIIDVYKKPSKNKPRTIFAVAGALHMIDANTPLTKCAEVLHQKLEAANIEYQVAVNNEAMNHINSI